MLVRDVMTENVVTISSDMSIADAKRIMQAHKFQRLPVVDKGKVQGIVTEHRLETVAPSKATTLSVWEMSYLLEKTPVKKVMEKDVVTVSPEMTVEEAIAMAQRHKVGSLLVIEDGRLAGIATTNDFFYKIANKVLGIGDPGTRVFVRNGGEAPALEQILHAINSRNLRMKTMHVIAPPGKEKNDVVLHLDTEDAQDLMKELQDKGYEVKVRKR
ncbi:MAG: CBS domain-containing protein [Desulfatibacillaceae bacterium]